MAQMKIKELFLVSFVLIAVHRYNQIEDVVIISQLNQTFIEARTRTEQNGFNERCGLSNSEYNKYQ